MKVLTLVLVTLLLSCGINMETHTVYSVKKDSNGMCVYKVNESIFHDSFVGKAGLYSVGDSLNKYFSVGAKSNSDVNKTFVQQSLLGSEDSAKISGETSGSE